MRIITAIVFTLLAASCAHQPKYTAYECGLQALPVLREVWQCHQDGKLVTERIEATESSGQLMHWGNDDCKLEIR